MARTRSSRTTADARAGVRAPRASRSRNAPAHQHARLRIPQHEGTAAEPGIADPAADTHARIEMPAAPHELERASPGTAPQSLRTNPKPRRFCESWSDRRSRSRSSAAPAQTQPQSHFFPAPPPACAAKQARQAPRPNLPPGRVPPDRMPRAPLPQQSSRHARPIRVRNRHPPAAAPDAPPALHRPRSKQVRAYSISPTIPLGPHPPPPLAHATDSRTSPPNRNRLKTAATQPTKARRRVGSETQHHLGTADGAPADRAGLSTSTAAQMEPPDGLGQQMPVTHPPNQLAACSDGPGHAGQPAQACSQRTPPDRTAHCHAPRNRAPSALSLPPAQPAQKPQPIQPAHQNRLGLPQNGARAKSPSRAPRPAKAQRSRREWQRHRRQRTVARQLDCYGQNPLQMLRQNASGARARLPHSPRCQHARAPSVSPQIAPQAAASPGGSPDTRAPCSAQYPAAATPNDHPSPAM